MKIDLTHKTKRRLALKPSLPSQREGNKANKTVLVAVIGYIVQELSTSADDVALHK